MDTPGGRQFSGAEGPSAVTWRLLGASLIGKKFSIFSYIIFAFIFYFPGFLSFHGFQVFWVFFSVFVLFRMNNSCAYKKK